MSIIGIAQSGLNVSLRRLEASASNVANAGNTGPVPATTPPSGRSADTEEPPSLYRPIRAATSALPGGGATSSYQGITPSYIKYFSPNDPNADSQGFVATPNVNQTDEAVEQLAAKQAAQANIKLIATQSQIDKSTFSLLG